MIVEAMDTYGGRLKNENFEGVQVEVGNDQFMGTSGKVIGKGKKAQTLEASPLFKWVVKEMKFKGLETNLQSIATHGVGVNEYLNAEAKNLKQNWVCISRLQTGWKKKNK